MNSKVLIENLGKLHTTEMGKDRIRRNLNLEVEDVVDWCRKKIESKGSSIYRNGKNWYIEVENNRITVNAFSYTIITAHKMF